MHALKRDRRSLPLASSANMIEPERANINIQKHHKDVKEPVPRLQEVLAYLRWMDRVDSWNQRRLNVQQTAARLRESEPLYSWNAEFGQPVVLPKIRKHSDPEKYESTQFQSSVIDPNIQNSQGQNLYEEMLNKKRQLRQMRSVKLYPEASKSLDERMMKYPAQARASKVRETLSADDRKKKIDRNSCFYLHARKKFKYWPEEIYQPPIHHTKFSFGDQFNPGRAGVITDRIYTRPRANKHYWTDFQLRQNPIGSGKSYKNNLV